VTYGAASKTGCPSFSPWADVCARVSYNARVSLSPDMSAHVGATQKYIMLAAGPGSRAPRVLPRGPLRVPPQAQNRRESEAVRLAEHPTAAVVKPVDASDVLRVGRKRASGLLTQKGPVSGRLRHASRIEPRAAVERRRTPAPG